MKSFSKSGFPLLALVVAFLIAATLSIDFDQEKFAPFTRSLVKCQPHGSGIVSKIRAELPAHALNVIFITLHDHALTWLRHTGALVTNPALVFTESGRPYRGPPAAFYPQQRAAV